VEAVIAGWLAGYTEGVVFTIAFTILAVKSRAGRFTEKWVAEEVPGVLLGVLIFLGASVGWTMVGLIIGSTYEVTNAKAGRDGFGSPSLVWTIAILGVAWLPLPPLVIFSRKFWWLWLIMCGSFAILFGWAVPLGASR
jgi:hypothetical protein